MYRNYVQLLGKEDKRKIKKRQERIRRNKKMFMER
jgi:hypothetical protein